jgi:hypothetical protein
MGFRLSSFLGGMAEGAIEIEENVRKRNEKLIDTSLTLSAERTAKSLEERKKQQEVYDMLAKQLSSFEGMDDNKVNVVLSYGPEVAKSFIESAPKKAARDGMSVADYVVIMETNEGTLPEVTTQKLISSNALPGMSEIKAPERPELLKSPILGRDYGDQYESTKEAVYGGMGIEIPEQAEGVTAPEGKINFMDLLSADASTEGLSLTRSGVNKSVAEYLVPRSNAKIDILKDGSLVYDEDQQAVASAISDIQTRVVSEYNNLIGKSPVRAAANPEAFYQIAFDNVLQSLPQSQASLFPGMSMQEQEQGDQGSGSAPDAPAPAPAPTGDVGSQISAIDSDATLTDAQKKAKKRTVVRNAGLATTIQEADQIIASGNY